jgi:V8-like Glu-specific endopeptidase
MQAELEELSAADLLWELRARAEQDRLRMQAGVSPEDVADLGLNPELAAIESDTLAEVLSAKQKVIYGVDDRVDLFQVSDQALLDDADCVVALFEAANIRDNGDGTSTLLTSTFGARFNLCAQERFRNQPTGAFCSGFLVGPDLVATAGHCADAPPDGPLLADIRFVFGFRMIDATTPPRRIPNTEIYRGTATIGRVHNTAGADWALIRLDRAVTNHRVATVRGAGRVPNGQAVHVIGHPSGLPTKLAGGARVRDNTPAPFFVANLDTFAGNSGSPVFNSDTHTVEGVLVRGERDFILLGEPANCTISLVCPTTGCDGEDCTRTTEFAARLPAFLASLTLSPDRVSPEGDPHRDRYPERPSRPGRCHDFSLAFIPSEDTPSTTGDGTSGCADCGVRGDGRLSHGGGNRLCIYG